jgi:PAS domain S-box-containing protein
MEKDLMMSIEQYKNLFEHSSLAIGYYKTNGIVISYNNKAAENMGGCAQDFAGLSMYDIFPKEDADLYMNRIEKAILSSTTMEYVDFISLPPGNRWYLSTFNRIHDKNGNIEGIQIISQDITMKKQADDALVEMEVKYRTMVAGISDVIGIMNQNGIITYKSPNIEKFFGWFPEDLIGTDYWLTVHPDDLGWLKKEYDNLLLKNGSSINVKYRYKCKDSSFKVIELTATNLVQNSAVKGIMMNYRNISDRIVTEEKLVKSEMRYRQLVTNLDAGVVVHASDTSIIQVNHKASELLGLSEEQLYGKVAIDPDWRFVHEDLVPFRLEEYPVNDILSSKNAIKGRILGVCQPDIRFLMI